MFNFRNLIPWASSTEYQQLSEDLYLAHMNENQEQQMSTEEASFTVGPADGGAIIHIKHSDRSGRVNTEITLSTAYVLKLIQLLEVAIADPADDLDPTDFETDAI